MLRSWLSLICNLVLLGLLAGCSRPHPVGQAPEPGAPRVVSLAPSLTEIICAIGAETQLVGRTSACDYPPDKLKHVPVVGGFGAPSLDLLLKLQPTLVLEVDLADAALAAAMEQAGLNRQRIACATVEDIPRAILSVGRLTKTEPAARALAEPLTRQIATLRQAIAARKAAGQPSPSVFVEIWGEPLTTCGKESFLSDLIALAGGRNLGDDASDKPYFSVSDEWVITRNPDVIICLDMNQTRKTERHKSESQRSEVSNRQAEIIGLSSNQQSTIGNQQFFPAWQRVAGRTGWAEIAAVKNRRVYGGLDDSVILRPGPRVLEAVGALRQCIEDPSR